MKRITKAFLISPFSVMPVIFLGMLVTEPGFFGHASKFSFSLLETFKMTVLSSLLALPVAYLCVGIFGVPYYLYLESNDKLSLKALLSSAFIAGTCVWLLVMHAPAPHPQFDIRDAVETLFAGLGGMAVAYTIWHEGIDTDANL